MGHEDRTTSTISFNASTRTFTIAPTASSFTVWCKGKKVVVSSAQTLVIPNTTGMHSIYYDANGTLSSKIGYFTFSDEAPTAYIYWNATTGTAPYFGDERHGVVLDWQTHEYLHRTRGAALASGFSASGYVLGGNGSSNSHAQLTIEGGTFFDEDMKIIVTATNTPTAGTWEQDLTSPARIPVLHLQGTAWVMDSPTDYPLKQGTARPQYNAYSGGVWSTADVANNKYSTTWVLATNNLTYPVIAIIGQAESDLQSAAEAVDFTELQLPGFPSVEFRPLYKLVFQCADSCTNAVHASLVSITDIRSIAAAGTAASIVSDHGNLTGLSDDDHPQYIHVDTLRTVSAAVKASFLPSQTSNAGKFLRTDGTATSWQALTSGNVTTALGFTPYNATNPSGYITGISSSDVTTALGFTPYNATNPSGYVNAAGARGAISVTGAGSYDSATGVINIVGGVTSFNTRTGAITLSSSDVTTALGFTPYNSTNPNGYLTGITSTQVTTALGYTPYNSSNPSGYITGITSGMVTTALGFTPYNNSNPSGYITSAALSPYLTTASAASTYLTPASAASTYLTTASAASTYAPLTGTGASGTWGISISGNAATVSNGLYKVGTNAIPAAVGLNTTADNWMWLWQASSGNDWYLGPTTANFGIGGSRLAISSSGSSPNAELSIERGTTRLLEILQANLQYKGNVVLHAGNYTSYAATSGHNHTYDVNNAWLRDANDDANVKLYGNTRQMVFRTDGTTEFASGIGGYAFAWMYGGDSAAERRMLLASNGRLWTNYHGWMDDAFAPLSHTHSYLPLSGGTLSGSIYFPNDSANGIFNAAGNAGYRPDDVYGNTYMFNQSGTNGGWYGDFSGYYFRSSSSSNWLTISGSAVNSSVALQQSGNQVLHAGNYTSYSPSLGGSGASGTWGINISGTASLATNAIRIQYNDGPRDLSDRLPNSFARTVNFDFVGAGTGNGSGNYAGVMTYSPWTGTTASTGDSSYQLAFANTTGVNASGQPKLSIRNGIDSTWNSWYTLLHSGNYSSYALPLSGGTLSGTLRFGDSTNGIYLSGGRLNIRSESTDNVAEYASYGLYLPKTGQAAGLYVESPIEARGGLRLGNSAGSGTITVGATTDATANRLVQRDGSGHINAAYVFGTYFNSNAGNSENPTIGQVWTQSTGDNYLRKSTPAHFISQLGLLTTSNYSSYALPLSGGTVSGNVSFGGAVNVNNRDIRYFENDSFKEFYVGGDANTYYPVLFGVSSWFHFARWSISRGYSDTAPWDPIGTGAHKGGLTLTWEWSGDGAWGGNDKTIRVIQFAEQYTTMVGGMHLSVNGFIVWLRGGNAYYRFHGPGGTMNSATPYYSTFTASNGGTFSPRSYDSGTVTAEVTNRMPVRGSHELYDTGNRVLHAGNYSSYALPISGGVVSGAVRASQITAGGSTNTDANLGVQGTTHLTGTIYYGGSVGNTSSWSSISNSSAGTHTFSGSRFIFDRYGYGSQSLLDLQNGAITLSQPTTISTGGGYPLQNLSTQRYIARFYNTSASGAGWWLANDSNTLVFHADSSGDKASINTDGTFSAANHVGSKFIAAYGNISDNVDGSPWYGLGNAGNLLGTGGNVVQLAGYFGLRLRSSTTVLDIGPDRATLNKTLNANGAAIRQGNNLARPLATWGSTGATGMVIFKLPGSSGNYGMVHMVFDIYEYNGNSVSTVIVGGHNWASSWYNTGANVVGQLGKQVRLGYKDGQYCVVFGDSGSYWEYGTIVLRKIHNGDYYNNIMDLGADVSVQFTATESFSNIGGDLRALRTPSSFNAGGAITQAGNQVLHAGNYTSYSPSLGGSGASGTWGISVSGSAAQLQGYQWFSAGKDIRGSDIYADSWLRNYNVNTGLYNQSTGCHFYSNGSASWGITGSGAGIELQFRANHQSTVRGYVYADSSSNFGLLHNGGGWSVQVYNGGNGYLHGTWNGGNIRANRANGNFYIDDNYGYGVVGVYSSYRYQGVFAMGDSYKLPADGTTTGSLYGMAWSHPNAGGAAGNLTDHGLLIINNGAFKCAISNSIVASSNITAYSDERLKTNWRDMPEDYVARLAQVKVGIYDRIDEEDVTQVGVSAQSFQKLLPQAIMTAKDEMQTLSVSYGNAALASAVELAKDNVELRARIERLESLINKLIGD
jgi:hypothetical protein